MSNKLEDAAMYLVAVAAIAALFVVVAWIGVARYRECRAVGFSAFYCLTSE